jgi:DNA polymerase
MSQMSREDMLRELELLPVWQLRQPLPMSFKTELSATDKNEIVVAEQLVKEAVAKEQYDVAVEMPVIEIAVAESVMLEPPMPESSISEPVPSAPPVLDALAPQQMEVVESIEEAVVDAPVLEQAQPLRLLMSENSHYAFLIEPYAAEDDVQQIEMLLKNMIRAMQVNCRLDLTDSAENLFATHTPKIIISLGAEAANRLSGKTYTIDEWRNIQHDNRTLYEQIPLIVTYHPSHLLANTEDKAPAWRDLCAAIKLVQSL